MMSFDSASIDLNSYRISQGSFATMQTGSSKISREDARQLLFTAASDRGVTPLLRHLVSDQAFAFRLSDRDTFQFLAGEIERGALLLESRNSPEPVSTANKRSYSQLYSLMGAIDPQSSQDGFDAKVVPYLIQVWLDDYKNGNPKTDIIQTNVSGFFYLFDVLSERLIAAWGTSEGRHPGARDTSRMAGHPHSAGAFYHRGHAIAHTLGGGTDINLVTQLGRINIGPFRPLERQAVASPGSLYFTYWTYRPARKASNTPSRQMPTGVDQGLLIPGRPPQITTHGN